MPIALPRPDQQYIKQFFDGFTQIWSGAHAHWATVIDPWYHATMEIWPPELRAKRSTHHSAKARGIIDHATDTQLAYIPKLHRDPVGEAGTDQQKDADAVEAATLTIFLDSQLKESMLTFKQVGKNLNMYGYTVAEGPVADMGDRPTRPTQRKGETDKEFGWRVIDYQNARKSWNPLRIQAPKPSSVLMDPLEKRPREAMKKVSIRRRMLLDMLNQARRRDSKPEFVAENQDVPAGKNDIRETVRMIHYWSDERHVLAMATGQILLMEKNTGGFNPLGHAFAGYGQEMSAEDQSNPRYMAEGLLDPVLDSLRLNDQNYSAKNNALMNRAYPLAGTTQDASEVQQSIDEDDMLHGTEEEHWFRVFPELGRSMFQGGVEIGLDIEEGTYSRNVSGIRQQGVSTVGQQEILSTASNRKFAPVTMQLNQLATVICQNILRLVDRMEQPIGVAGKILKPSQLHHDYNITATFEVIDPIVELRKRETGMQEVRLGLKSDESYRENDMRVANESLERKRLLRQRIRSHPAVVEAEALAIAEELGVAEILEDFIAKSQGAGDEPAPNPTGLVLPNGEPVSPRANSQNGGGNTRPVLNVL